MHQNLATPWLRFGSALLLLAVAPRGAAGHQPSGVYATTPGALASYEYHIGVYQTEMVPLDAIIVFSGDNPPTMLTATFYKPIIGALSDGTPIYPIGAVIPLTVAGASSNGQDFTGDLLGTQYLFDWSIEPAGDELVWNGVVGWAGGRYEQTRFPTRDSCPSTPTSTKTATSTAPIFSPGSADSASPAGRRTIKATPTATAPSPATTWPSGDDLRQPAQDWHPPSPNRQHQP